MMDVGGGREGQGAPAAIGVRHSSEMPGAAVLEESAALLASPVQAFGLVYCGQIQLCVLAGLLKPYEHSAQAAMSGSGGAGPSWAGGRREDVIRDICAKSEQPSYLNGVATGASSTGYEKE